MTGPLSERDIKNLIENVKLNTQKLDEREKRITSLENKVEFLQREVKDLDDSCEEYERRIRDLEVTVGRLSERTTLFQLGQATWSTVASIIATILSINLR